MNSDLSINKIIHEIRNDNSLTTGPYGYYSYTSTNYGNG